MSESSQSWRCAARLRYALRWVCMFCEVVMRFEGKTVVVVSVSTEAADDPRRRGAAAHIGAACAQAFAEEGARIVLVDEDAQTLDALAAQLRALGTEVLALPARLGDSGSLSAAAAACEAQCHAVDVLLNCHSDMEIAGFEASHPDSWSRVIQYNLLGTVYASKAFLPLLKRAGQAAIVHIGSIDGALGNAQIASYSAAKGGLVPLTHVMADELGRYGIRVNTVARAMINGRDVALNPRYEPLVAQTPLARPGYPDEVAAVVKFLASSEAAYVSGAIVPVDGGRSGITPGTRVPT